MKPNRLLMVLALCGVLFSPSCTGINPPPNLDSQASAAFRNTQVIKMLDLMRDIAIDANAQNPPLVSTETARKVVLFHRTTIKLIDATTDSWAATVMHNLDDLNKNTPAADQGVMRTYYDLLTTKLKGMIQ